MATIPIGARAAVHSNPLIFKDSFQQAQGLLWDAYKQKPGHRLPTGRKIMNRRKPHLLTLLIAAAALSVVAFAGIGVAAITGHVSMNPMGPNPLAGLLGKPKAKVAATATRPKPKATRPVAEGARPIDFRPGSRVRGKRTKCNDCGIVDSIRAREVESSGILASDFRGDAADNGRSYGTRSPDVTYAALTRATDARVEVNFVVTVRMEDGTVRTIHENQRPPFSIGERVRLVNGSVLPQG
jgi:hypothetical protein